MKKFLIIWLIIQIITFFVAMNMNTCYNVVAEASEKRYLGTEPYTNSSYANETHTNTTQTKTTSSNGRLYFNEAVRAQVSATDDSQAARSPSYYFAAWITLSQVIDMFIVGCIVVYLVLGLFINNDFFNKNRTFLLVYGMILFMVANMLSITKRLKPMIYLYPENDNTAISVTVDDPSIFSCTYPNYGSGWNVTANRDGTLIGENGRSYYGLYWEGYVQGSKDFKDGFLIEGKDVASFLEEKLEILGLSEREANEFIVYWLPILEKNKYNLIHFKTTEEINSEVPLNISPEPDTVIRVLMQYKSVPFKVNIKEQQLEKVERNGFTVVEWGGEKEGLLK